MFLFDVLKTVLLSLLRWFRCVLGNHLENISYPADLIGFSLVEAENMSMVEFLWGYHSKCKHYFLDPFVVYVLCLDIVEHFGLIERGNLLSLFLTAELLLHCGIPMSEDSNKFILVLREIFQVLHLLLFLHFVDIELKLCKVFILFLANFKHLLRNRKV